MSIFPVPQFFRLIPLRGSWLRVKTKGNISFLFDLFLFCFVLNSKLKFPSPLINYFKSELVTRLFQTKYLAFLTTCWSISPRASVLPLLLVRFDAFSALRQQFSATVWIWILTSKYVSSILWHCMIHASMIFVKIFLLNNFDFWRPNSSTEAAGKFFIDIATLTFPLSLVHRPLILLLVVSFVRGLFVF